MIELITVGRANMDLYSTDIGAPFAEVRNFEAMVGGSPTNIAISTRRHGVTSAAFTGVGEDVVGDFVIDYLQAEGVGIDFVARIAGKATSLALLGVQPPDHFPLLFYRDDPADIHLTVDHASALPLEGLPAVQLSGNAFSRGTCADAAWAIADRVAETDTVAFLDLDLRPTDWADPADFGKTMRRLLPLVDWVGMDIKAAGSDYESITGVRGSGEKAWQSAKLLLDSGVAHEFRTTVHPDMLDAAQLRLLADELRALGAERYALQECVTRHCRDPARREALSGGLDPALARHFSERFADFSLRRA